MNFKSKISMRNLSVIFIVIAFAFVMINNLFGPSHNQIVAGKIEITGGNQVFINIDTLTIAQNLERNDIGFWTSLISLITAIISFFVEFFPAMKFWMKNRKTRHQDGSKKAEKQGLNPPPKPAAKTIIALFALLISVCIVGYSVFALTGTPLRRDYMVKVQQPNGEFVEMSFRELITTTARDIARSNVRKQIRGWNSNGYQYILFGAYQQKDGYPEPILWRILYVNNNQALVLSEYIIDTRRFDDSCNSWMSSEARAWLNGDFLNNAFTATQRAAIIENKDPGSVFLLTQRDYVNPAYGFSKVDNQARRAQGSFYAINHNLWQSDEEYSSYFTRTSNYKDTVWQVRSTGAFGAAKANRSNVGIRPAMWIDLLKTNFDFGEGTTTIPFQCVFQ